jgi:hypothetical protein
MGCCAAAPAQREAPLSLVADSQVTSEPSSNVVSFQVKMKKDEHTSLGAALMENSKRVIVLGIADKGSLQDWNNANPDKQVIPGDRIVAVNGVDTGYFEIAAELWKTGSLVLQIERDESSKPVLQRTHSRTLLAEHAMKGDRLDMRCPVDDLPHVDAESCGATECAICFEDYTCPGTRVVKLPCNHSFHPVCAARWFSRCDRRRICPLCKQEA